MKADICIIANGGAKGMIEQSARDSFVETVKRAIPSAWVKFTSKQLQIETLVEEALNEGATIIVAAGGDGTVNAVVELVVGTDTILGVLPFGTLNHFAKDLGIPAEVEGALEVLARGNVATVDVGKVNDRHFVNNSGLGLYPDMVFNREQQQKHGVSKWSAAFIESVRALKRYRMLNIEIEIDGRRVRRRTPAVFIGNNEYQFSPLRSQNRTSLVGGKLSLYVPHPRSRAKLGWYALRAFFGKAKSDADFDRFIADRFTISTSNKPLSVSLDGEVVSGESPLEYESLAGALRVMVPIDSPTVHPAADVAR